MRHFVRTRVALPFAFVVVCMCQVLAVSTTVDAQTPAPTAAPSAPTEPAPPPGQTPPPDHEHTVVVGEGTFVDGPDMDMMDMMTPGWHFMQDGVVYGILNNQGGTRGGDLEFKAPNWWMGMWSRAVRQQAITVTTMLSLDPATVGREGYAELFQTGESLDGRAVIDRQHPHDAFMQLAGSWRVPLGATTGLTLAGGPAGEPALGPIAFMHRASAADNPTAPLGHHTFDSTHVAFGVVTAAIDHKQWTLEASAFNGREPDDHRWNLDLGPLDSFSGRVWFQPDAQWAFQVSSGFLKSPEALEPGNQVRTTISGSWLRREGADFTAVTVGYGVNRFDATEGSPTTRTSIFAEATRRFGANALYGRFEAHEPDIALLLTGETSGVSQGSESDGTVLALTAGVVRNVVHTKRIELGLGGDITVYRVPDVLRPDYGRPVSFHLFLRLGPAGGARMWNARMAGPMSM